MKADRTLWVSGMSHSPRFQSAMEREIFANSLNLMAIENNLETWILSYTCSVVELYIAMLRFTAHQSKQESLWWLCMTVITESAYHLVSWVLTDYITEEDAFGITFVHVCIINGILTTTAQI